MDLSCIISSGDLELYVLGLLPNEDAQKIEQLSLMFPEIQAELNAIEQSLIGIAANSDDAPSLAVKDNLFAKLKTLQQEEIAKEDAEESMRPQAKILNMPQRRRTSSMLVAAQLIGLLIGAAIISYLIINNTKSNKQLVALKTQVNQLQQGSHEQDSLLSQYARSVQLYQNPDYQKVNLVTVPGKPEALVQIFWNHKNNNVFASNVSLPQAPAGKQYQLWAIVDGKPVSAGMLSNSKKLTEQMASFAKAELFAITLEVAGGSPTPTMTEMYVAGKPI